MGRWKALFLASGLIAAAGCGKRPASLPELTGGVGTGMPSAEEAAQATYRYAFSAQVTDASSGTALSEFAVSVLREDSAISAVLNSLGDKNGLFHISRNPTGTDAAFGVLPLLVSAPGHKPSIQFAEVGADCVAGQCPGVRPVMIKLIQDLVSPPLASASAFSPLAASQNLLSSGAGTVFRQLVQNGKLDPEIQRQLAVAKNGDVFSNVLVVLNSAESGQASQLVSSLLSGANSEKLKGLTGGLAASLIPLIASSKPDLSAALLGSNAILPYLTPLLNQGLAGKSGPMGDLLKTLLGDSNSQVNFVSLMQSLASKQTDKKASLQLAMATFLPMLQGLIAKKEGATANPFGNVLLKTLLDPSFFNMIASLGDKTKPKDEKAALVLGYLQPLVQGLGGKNSPEIGYLFNLLLKDGGLAALKDFPKDATAQEKFAKLIPYIDPIIRGLNSPDATKIADFLLPMLASGNPAASLRDLLTKLGSGNQSLSVIAGLLPALEPLLKQTVPGKQILSAQLLQGLVNGDFKNLQVTKDLQGSPAVLLSGQALDILKLVQLPNVEKVVALTP